MSGNNGFHPECSEEFAELCALSVTNALSTQERQKFEHHVAGCLRCSALLTEFKRIVTEGMAREAARRDAEGADMFPRVNWDRERAKAKLLAKITSRNSESAVVPETVPLRQWRVQTLGIFSWRRAAAFAGIAATLLIAAFSDYQFGIKRGMERGSSYRAAVKTEEDSLHQQLATLQAERATLAQKTERDSKSASDLEQRLARAESDLGQLQLAKATFETKAQELTNQNQKQSSALAALATEREALQEKLRDAESSVQQARQELTVAQDERQRGLLQSANLENQVSSLSVQLREREAASNRQDQYLASDRDIRELMGARQLYIADVFDVDSQGKTRAPFGRVFYTRGKSLIFYAFDLDREPGYREAKAFQAWGRPGPNQTAPVSLGVFYMDNEANRRWALKFDDPKVLEEINSVFVTVEPKGGSKKPTNKPFLLAYLHTAPPNHP